MPPENKLRSYILGASLLILSAAFLAFGILVIAKDAVTESVFYFCGAIVSSLMLIFLRSKINERFTSTVFSSLFALLCIYLVFSGSETAWTVVWALTFPSITVFLLSLASGALLSALIFAALFLALFIPGMSTNHYTATGAFIIISAYVIMFVVSWALEWGRLAKQRTLETVIYDEQRAMLVDTLTDSCKLACLHYNKRAEFVENFISSAALRKTSGTALKDILVELVQNAVAHGIEAPDLRLRAGKNETGRITLSIYEKNNMIRAELNDDGAGFDFGEASRGAANYVKSLFGSSSRRNEARAPRTGLNIVCSRLIALRGKLNIKTKMGRGSSFIIDVAVLSHNAGPKLADSV